MAVIDNQGLVAVASQRLMRLRTERLRTAGLQGSSVVLLVETPCYLVEGAYIR